MGVWYGLLAQLARAPRLHRGGRGFEPLATHHRFDIKTSGASGFLGSAPLLLGRLD